MRVCVVGGGLTGAIAAHTIRRALPNAQIELWDKGKQFGGRMCTKRCPSEPRTCNVDVGAQYISNTPQYKEAHKDAYQKLLASKVLVPLSCSIKDDRHPLGTNHYIAPLGMSELVKHYVREASCTGKLEALVTDVSKEETNWKISTEDKSESFFDAVLLTLPVPQLLALNGTFHKDIDALPSLRSSLDNVEYSSRICLGLFYSPQQREDISLPDNAGAAYLKDNSHPFCYVAIDTIKRELNPESVGGISVMVHTNREFGALNIDEDKDSLHASLLKKFREVMPHWPQPNDSLCHKWRYSQVVSPMPSAFSGSVSLSSGSLVLSGDAFTHSNVDGCLKAGTDAAEKVVSYLSQMK